MKNILIGSMIFLLPIVLVSNVGAANDVTCSGCVDKSDIAVKAVTENKLATYSVTSSKIAKEAVTTNKIRNQAVTTQKILASAVTTGKIKNKAVTMEKLSPELQGLLGDLQKELDRLSPDADLTGATYCFVGLNTWLSAGNGAADVTADPYKFRLDFTSSTEVTFTDISDPYSTINIPAYTMTDTVGAEGPESITYTMIGNQLDVGGDSILYAGPSGDVLIGGLADRSVFGNIDHWEAGIYIGVRAASCN